MWFDVVRYCSLRCCGSAPRTFARCNDTSLPRRLPQDSTTATCDGTNAFFGTRSARRNAHYAGTLLWRMRRGQRCISATRQRATRAYARLDAQHGVLCRHQAAATRWLWLRLAAACCSVTLTRLPTIVRAALCTFMSRRAGGCGALRSLTTPAIPTYLPPPTYHPQLYTGSGATRLDWTLPYRFERMVAFAPADAFLPYAGRTVGYTPLQHKFGAVADTTISYMRRYGTVGRRLADAYRRFVVAGIKRGTCGERRAWAGAAW